MKRTTKNLILIILLLGLLLGNYFTVKYISDTSTKETLNEKSPNDQMPKEPPEMPKDDNKMDIEVPNDNIPKTNNFEPKESITKVYYLIFIAENSLIALIISYLLLSKLNKKTLKETFINSDKITIYILMTILLIFCITALDILLTKQTNLINNQNNHNPNRFEEKLEKETTTADIEAGVIVNKNEINLSDYDTNITLNKEGTYTLKGEFTNSVIIDSKGEVKLNLDNVTITNNKTATIINKSNNNLILNLIENTVNTLTDGGSSEYDACIYSLGALTIEGTGKLFIYGKQVEGEGIATETNDLTINNGEIYIESVDDGLNAGGDGGTITINNGTILISANGDGIDSNKNLIINGGTIYTIGSSLGGDAGIDTDSGFTINGGLVIALGSDMLEPPLNTSKQNSLCFNLPNNIAKDTLITLMDDENNVITSFLAKENFKTLIISSSELKSGTYYLYQNGTNTGTLKNNIYYNSNYSDGSIIKINNSESFKLTSNVTKIGSDKRN